MKLLVKYISKIPPIIQNIGKALNKKDHTTVIHGIEKITDDMTKNEELKNKIGIIKKKLNCE